MLWLSPVPATSILDPVIRRRDLFTARAIVGMDPIEHMQAHSASLRKYLDILPIHFKSNEEFIRLIGLTHLDGRSITHFKQLFQLVCDKYTELDVDAKEFISFYNKVLSKLFDFYSYPLGDKDDILQLRTLPWLGLDEQKQEIYWETASKIYFVDDKPSYDILPDAVKDLLQPQFTNRDKNRFGQIAKRLGQDTKKTITQTLQPVTVLHELPASHFFPSFAESLALAEVLLETNLDPWLEDLRKALVKTCPSITIELHNKGNSLGKFDNIAHKITCTDRYEIYVTRAPIGRKNYFYASGLHDLLVELLQRDMQRIKLSFNDFFSQSSPSFFIERYEVSPDRVEEISGRLTGTILSREQSFWMDVLNALHIAPDPAWFPGNRVDYFRLGSAILSSPDAMLPETLDYQCLDRPEHIAPLAGFFNALDLSLKTYNAIASFPLDFAPYYRRQFTALRYQRKNEFRYLLYKYLLTQDLATKAGFQRQLENYAELIEPVFESPCLLVDLETEFQSSLHATFPDVKFPAPADWMEDSALIDRIFRKNHRAFKAAVRPQPTDEEFYLEFLSHLDHRSLLYFEGTLDTLQTKYKEFYKERQPLAPPKEEDLYQLSQYSNSESLVIQSVLTTSLPPSANSNGKSRAMASRRLDGSIQPPALQKIGMVAEKMVYDILTKRFQQVEWVSSNAARAGYNPEGSDVHGYDLSYLGDDHTVHYVEVKGKNDSQKHFYVSYPEVQTALREKEHYHLFFVSYVMDNEQREIFDLGNLFLLEGQHDLFHNDRFTATFNTLEISFF